MLRGPATASQTRPCADRRARSVTTKAQARINHLNQAPAAADACQNLITPGRAAVPEYVRTCLGHRHEDVSDTVIDNSEVTQRIPQNAAHHGHADRLGWEREAELDVHGRLLRTGHQCIPPPRRFALVPVNLVTL